MTAPTAGAPPEATRPERPLAYRARSADVLYCLRIPFAGGDRLVNLVRQAFPQRAYQEWPPSARLASPSVSLGMILAGEESYRVYRNLPRKPVYLTVLADPVARMAAALVDIQARPQHPLYGLTPEEALSSEFARSHLHDRQVRLLTGLSPGAADAPSEDVILEIARVRVDEFAYFGLADRWADSVHLFGQIFGVQLAGPNEVEPEGPPEVTDRARLERLVQGANPLDARLMTYARELFEERLRQAPEELPVAVGRLNGGSGGIGTPMRVEASEGPQTSPLGRSTGRVPLAADDVLLFVHIPKSGGLSLISLLDDLYPYRQILPLHSVIHPSVFHSFDFEQFGRFRLARGHFLFGPYDGSLYRYLVQNPILMTLLREPEARTLSAFQHTLRRPQLTVRIKHIRVGQEHPPSRIPGAEGPEDDAGRWESLRRFLENPQHASQLRNRQTQFVLGAICPLTPGVGTVTTLSEAAMLRLAMERLEQMAFVGLTERYEDSLQVMAHTFGWPRPTFVPRLNIAPRDWIGVPMPDDIRDKIEALTAVDAELYRYARALFDERWQAMVRDREQAGEEAPLTTLTYRQPVRKRLTRSLWSAIHLLLRFRFRWLTRASVLDHALHKAMQRWLT